MLRAMSWPVLGLGLASLLGCTHSLTTARAAHAPAAFGKAASGPDIHTWFHPERESQVLAVEAGVAGDRIAALVDLPAESCAVFIARGTDSVEDLDLSAFGEDGAILGMDEGADKTPALLICPPHPGRVYVAARIASGQGLVAVGVERMPPKDAERAASIYHARHSQADLDSRLAAWPGLAERIAEHRKRLGGKWQDVRRVAVPLDARIPTRISATVEENTCLSALVLTSEELSRLELSVQDENGQTLGRAAALGHDRSLVVCSPLGSTLSFELRPQGGRGVAVLVLSQTAPGTSNDIDDAWRVERYETGTLADARQKAATRLEGLGYPNAKVLKTGALQPGRLDSVSFALPKGCARLDILVAAPVRDVSARLWAADDSLIAESEQRASPVLFACTGGGQARLDTESLSRPGAYSVELRVEPEIPALLPGSPLAAGRLLTRMLEHGLIRSGAQAGKITHHDLSPEHLDHEDLIVPAGRCIEVTLALGPGSTGAELRLRNDVTGEELALARGTVVTSARACALDASGGGTLHARAEFRVAAGHGEALSTSRLSTPPR